MRVAKLHRSIGLIAIASSALLVLVIVDVVIVAIAGGFTNIWTFESPPAWIRTPEIAAQAMLAVAALAASVVAVGLAWMHRRARGGIAYFALASAMVVPCVVVISALAPPVFGADGIGIASTVIVGGCGMYLILINLAGFWAGTLGQALPWLGFASGALLLTAAVFGIHAWAAVFPAIALYILWSAWLGVHLWNWAPAEAGAVPS